MVLAKSVLFSIHSGAWRGWGGGERKRGGGRGGREVLLANALLLLVILPAQPKWPAHQCCPGCHHSCFSSKVIKPIMNLSILLSTATQALVMGVRGSRRLIHVLRSPVCFTPSAFRSGNSHPQTSNTKAPTFAG